MSDKTRYEYPEGQEPEMFATVEDAQAAARQGGKGKAAPEDEQE